MTTTTIFGPSPTSSYDSQHEYGGFTFRLLIPSSKIITSANSFSVRIEGLSGKTYIIQDLHVGTPIDHLSYDYSSAPTRITFNGGDHALTITGDDDVWSDPVEFPVTTSSNLLFSFHLDSSSYDYPPYDYYGSGLKCGMFLGNYADSTTMPSAPTYERDNYTYFVEQLATFSGIVFEKLPDLRSVVSQSHGHGGMAADHIQGYGALSDLGISATGYHDNHVVATLPDLGLTAYGKIGFNNMIATLPDLELSASTGVNISMDLLQDNYLPALRLKARTGGIISADLKLPDLRVSGGFGAYFNKILPDLRLSGTALPGGVGSLSGKLPVLTLSGQTGAVLNSDLPTLLATATALSEFVGSLSQTLPGLQITASTSLNQTLTLSRKLPMLSVSAHAYASKLSELNQKLSSLIIAAEARIAGGGSLDGILPDLAISANAVITALGEIDANLPTLVMGDYAGGSVRGGDVGGIIKAGGRFASYDLGHSR